MKKVMPVGNLRHGGFLFRSSGDDFRDRIRDQTPQISPFTRFCATSENDKTTVETVVLSSERAMRLELTTYSMASCRSSQLSYARA